MLDLSSAILEPGAPPAGGAPLPSTGKIRVPAESVTVARRSSPKSAGPTPRPAAKEARITPPPTKPIAVRMAITAVGLSRIHGRAGRHHAAPRSVPGLQKAGSSDDGGDVPSASSVPPTAQTVAPPVPDTTRVDRCDNRPPETGAAKRLWHSTSAEVEGLHHLVVCLLCERDRRCGVGAEVEMGCVEHDGIGRRRCVSSRADRVGRPYDPLA